MFLVTSPIVINVPTRGLLAVETMHAIVQWLANLNIKGNMTPRLFICTLFGEVMTQISRSSCGVTLVSKIRGQIEKWSPQLGSSNDKNARSIQKLATLLPEFCTLLH